VPKGLWFRVWSCEAGEETADVGEAMTRSEAGPEVSTDVSACEAVAGQGRSRPRLGSRKRRD
jgi:hypothetical protein